MPDGWIKLHRKLLESQIFQDPSPTILHVWIALLLLATHQPNKRNFCGKSIELQPGQLITGRDQLARLTGRTASSVERALNRLQSGQQIEQQKLTKGRIITVLNWESYQSGEQQAEQQTDNKRTAKRSNPNTIQECTITRMKEVRSKESVSLSPVAPNCEFFRISEQELAQAQTRYRTNGYPVELIPIAIEVIEGWLAGDTVAAIRARKLPTHYRRLYADWVIQKAVQMRDAKASANGNGHRPRGEYKSRFERQQDILKKQLIREMQNGNFSANDSTLDATFDTIPLLPVGRGDH